MECPSNADVPADIIRNIMLRLSVKILSQLKCVCKEWNTLIKSQSFVNEHFVCESNHEHLLVFKPDRHRLIYVDECSSDYLPMSGKVCDVKGPVNGLFCVASNIGGIGLLNPALKQFKPLPFLDFRPLTNFLGFGFDPLSGYYKVVLIKKVLYPIYRPPVVSVYNSGSDSWTLLDEVDSGLSSMLVLDTKSSTYLNGVYYWLMMHNNADSDVLAFDMSSYKFRVIRLPDVIRKHKTNRLQAELAVYGGDSIVILSFILPFYGDDEPTLIDMWVLGNDGLWTKRSTFGPIRELKVPLGFSKNNELMLETDTGLLTMYNVFTHELRHVHTIGKMFDPIYSVPCIYRYKESLVSLKGEGEGEEDNCKLWDISSAFVINFFGCYFA